MLGSPAAQMDMSPTHLSGSSPLEFTHQSPTAPFETGVDILGPVSTSVESRQQGRLTVEIDNLSAAGEVDRSLPSAASSTKRKPTGKKLGLKAGTKKKPAKLKQSNGGGNHTDSDGFEQDHQGQGQAQGQSQSQPQHPQQAQAQAQVQKLSPQLSSEYKITPAMSNAMSSAQRGMFPQTSQYGDELHLDSNQLSHSRHHNPHVIAFVSLYIKVPSADTRFL